MSGHGEKLSRKQEAAIAALLSAPRLEDAAQTADVSVASLRRWRKLATFRARYAEARAEVLDRTVAVLLSASTYAVAVLQKNLLADKPGDQIRAACAILDLATKGCELVDLAEQLAELRELVEKQLAEGLHPHRPRRRA